MSRESYLPSREGSVIPFHAAPSEETPAMGSEEILKGELREGCLSVPDLLIINTREPCLEAILLKEEEAGKKG